MTTSALTSNYIVVPSPQQNHYNYEKVWLTHSPSSIINYIFVRAT